MKPRLPAITVMLGGVLSAGILAAAPAGTAAGPGTFQVAAAEGHPGEGEVTKIDHAKGQVTLSHRPIASLEWPAMRMLFGVAEPGLLDGVKVGDRVRFVLQKTADGRFVITEIKPM